MTQLLILLVALLHFGFFILERFIWQLPAGLKIFGMTAEQAQLTANLAANQGVYNLLLALGLIWTLRAEKSEAVVALRYFILIFIISVGLYGALTVSKSILFVQTLPALVALVFVFIESARPRINDIAAFDEKVPQFKKIAEQWPQFDYSYRQEYLPQQKKYYPQVRPLALEDEKGRVFEAILEVIEQNYPNWKIVERNSSDLIVEAMDTTRFFRFVDDIVIHVVDDSHGSKMLMRSRSRKGQSDFGKNARRIESFFKDVLKKY